MSKIEIVTNQKNGHVALYNGYEYHINGKRGDKQYWRCTKYAETRCPGRMNTVGEIVNKVLDHSHAPDVRTGHVRKVLQNIRNAAATTNEPPKRVIRNNTCNIENPISAVELPSNLALSRTVSRIRKKIGGIQKCPKTLAELVIKEEYTQTLKGDKFVLFDNDDALKRMIIFTTNANLTFLSYCDEWYMDGTFDVVPPLFKQLYTIHGRRNKTFLPMVYVLACGKDFFTYEQIFSKLKETEPRLKPKKIMSDFEMAAMKAAKEVFPEAKTFGCFFHLCQCFYRQIQQNGLQTAYSSDATFAQYLRCLPALAFVPPEDVMKHFNALKKFVYFEEKLLGKATVDVGVQNIFAYVEKNWVGYWKRNRFVAAKFPIELWNVYQLTLDGYPRTNNAVEAWHNALKQ